MTRHPYAAQTLRRWAERLDPHPTREAIQSELARKAHVAAMQRAERMRAHAQWFEQHGPYRH